MAWGVWANVAVTAMASLAYGAAGVAAGLRRRRVGDGALAVPTLFGTIAVFLALAAIRQVAAGLSGGNPAYVDIDRRIFLVLLAPAAIAILPLVYLLANIVADRPGTARVVTAAFSIPVAVGLFFAYRDGVSGPDASAFGTEWTIVSPVTPVILVGAILLPALVGSLWLVQVARRLPPGDARRVRLVGWSSAAYFVVFTLDALGLTGVPLLLARVATAATGVVVWRAYAPAETAPAGG